MTYFLEALYEGSSILMQVPSFKYRYDSKS